MATLTIRNLPEDLLRRLKALAKRRRRSMEQEVRELLREHVADRLSVLEQIESSWPQQGRRPDADEVDDWIRAGRP